MSAPKVSVLLPVYNGLGVVRTAIQSVLRQDFRDFELVIVDDGSSDGTAEILAAARSKDERIVVVRNATNRGLIASLNRGLASCRGEYVARQDADDVSSPERLRLQAAHLDAHPEVGVVASAYYRLRDGETRILRRPPAEDTAIRWKLLFGNCWCHSTVMFRRDLLDAGETAYGAFLHAEDYELWCRLLTRSKGHTLAAPLVDYADVPGEGVSQQNPAAQAEMAERISERQIREVLPDIAVEECAAIRRLARAGEESVQWAGTLPFLFELMDAFRARPEVESAVMDRVEAAWLRRFLEKAGTAEIVRAWRSGLLRPLRQRHGLRLLGAGPRWLRARARRLVRGGDSGTDAP